MIDNTYSVMLVTVPDEATADKLANELVERKLAACVNIIPKVKSVYRSEGKVEKADELLLTIKTRRALVLEIGEFIRKNHPYDLPETISLPIGAGTKQYLDWIGANTVFAK
jgi:periplasmic divalent cation tolerance protein